MPDYFVEMTQTLGRGDVNTRSVTVQDCANPELAKIIGIEELLKWATDEDSPVPDAAYQYFLQTRNNGNVMVYELLSELETRWQLSFICKPASTMQAEAPPERPSPQRKGGAVPVPSRQPLDFKGMLAAQLETLVAREKELHQDRRNIDDELSEVRESIGQIRSFLMFAAGTNGRKRRKEKAVVAESAQS